jgi:membrane protease YdiL (CAAX protease family)
VWLVAALAVAALLVVTAHLSLELVPATSEAPIQSFVSWPSGMLCFAALGMVLPLGEELFFRGYLYRVALALGRAAAFWITFVLFVALHAEQSWGNWGGLVAVAVTGLALTGLRAQSGSVLIPALAHVLYNFTLSMGSF